MESEIMTYLNDNQDVERAPFKLKIKEINLILTMNGFGEIGDLFDPSLFSVNKTISVIKALIEDRKKLLENKNTMMQKISKNETEYSNIFKNNEVSKDKITELTNLNSFLKNKIFKEEKSFKEEIDKLKNDKDELNKKILKLTQKETKYKHEIKKKEFELTDIKNKLKKYMNDKESITNTISNNNPNKDVNFKINQTLTNINYSTPSKEALISFENLIKNSNSVLLNVNHLKEFYNLLFQAFNEKINYITTENNDLRECYKIIIREINKYMEIKKIVLQKISRDVLYSKENQKRFTTEIPNESLLNLDFNQSREQILNNFNEIINNFRYILIYDQLKLEPNKEYQYDELNHILNNTKFDMKNLPYYKEIEDLMDNFDVNSLKTLKTTLDSLNQQTQDIQKSCMNKNMINNNLYGNGENITKVLSENKSLDILDEINKDFNNSINMIDDKLKCINFRLDPKNVENNKNLVGNKGGATQPPNIQNIVSKTYELLQNDSGENN